MKAGPENDVLARSIRAWRREEVLAGTSGAPIGDDAVWGREHTWLRIATGVRRARAVRRWMAIGALQLALGLCGATVWGAATGRLQPAARAAVAAVKRLVSRARQAAPAPRRAPVSKRDVGGEACRRLTAPATTAVAAKTVAPASAPPTAPSRRASHGRPPSSERPRPVESSIRADAPNADSPAVAAPATEGVAETHALLALYREAHRLHFVERDYAAALEAWDHYLAAGPGPLALEARYNRAIALGHLGRPEEAIAALRPFADGERGGYRRQEALQLIEVFRRGADAHLRDP